MSDHKKTKAQLLQEIAELRQEVTRLKVVEAQHLELQVGLEQPGTTSEAQAQRLTSLNEMSRQLNTGESEAELFQIAAQQIPRVFAGSQGSVAVLNETGDQLRLLTWPGDGATHSEAILPVEDTMVGTVVRENLLLVASDFQSESWTEYLDVQQLARAGLRACMDVPLVIEEQVIGTLNVASAEANAFSQQDETLITQMASFLAGAIENRRLIEQIQQRAAELEETTNFLDSIVANLPTMLFVKDAEELRFVRWNSAAERLIGFKRAEMIGKNDYDLFPPEEADFFIAKDREVLRQGKLLDISEEPIQTADKGVRWLHTRKVPVVGADGEPKYLLGISEDITDRKLTAEILADERKLLRTLIDNLPDYIYAKDRHGRFLLNNIAHTRLMGEHSPDDLRGKSDADFYPAELAKQYLADEMAIMEAGQPIFNHEEPNLNRQTGEQTWTSTTKVPLRDSQGNVVGLVGISRDITERKRTEEMLGKRAAELETVAQVSIAASTILDVDRLVQEVADLTKERFGLYHAHIYRLSQSHNVLDLVAGAGEVGRQMVADRWSIPLDREQSLVARAGRTRRGVIANDVQREPDWLPNPLLPSTRSEMAVPMIVGDQVIGVLDVQADRTDYFTEEDLRIHTTLAAQVAVALENARLFEQTQQRAAELEETTVFLDFIVENIPNMIFVKDAEELRFVRFNQAGESLIGVSRAEMIGKNDYDFFPPEEADFFVAKDREVLATGNLVDIPEETIQTLDKGTRFLHTTKVPVYGTGGQAKFLLGISEDITERKHADAERERLLAEVQRSEVRNRALLNAIPDLIIRYSKDGVHLDVKAAVDFETFLPAQELIGKTVAEVMSPELARQRLAYMEQAWQSGEVQLYEHQFLREDKTTYEEIRVVPSGEDEIFVIIRDITERKREEAERERLLAEVQSAYRQYLRREWDQFLRERHRGNWRVEHKQPGLPVETGAEHLADLKAEVKQAGQTRIVSGIVANGPETEPAVVTPISLRGEILGTLSLQDIDPERKWTDEEIALIEAVSEQLALTLENLRLFEDTKQLATREKIIADVTQEVWASGELEQVMQTAVEQLGAKLDASKVIIRLGTTDQLQSSPGHEA